MSISLRRMTASRYADFYRLSLDGYVASNIRSGRWDAADAPAKAAEQMAKLLPQGLATPEHHFFDVISDEGEAVGVVWFALNRHGAGKQAWLYDILIDEAHRGQGLGRAAMQAFEAEAIRLGAASLGLNVFAYNDAAAALYRSLGFQPTSQQMSKPLPAA
ncbi:GNAT family N-acetyltransferase [Chitinimonas arctica]|uniref:GNAT family N-acetyltransferase n=1 Tax=Chitinimonas arctica TaxID=2594795 RepID=A0A516SJQ5_9NEIS|nr:GNAT family N-acetyltransferase [Chitinimonas arctica]QDQ28389.1 GNAT family N-acetyltransferase [Chitinimonas arctica]